MPDLAISIRDLGKRYRLSHSGGQASYRTLRETLSRAAKAPWRRLRGEPDETSEEFWALQNVSLDVRPGEVVGVIGRNGAGKSTLLKILSRITKPTAGEVTLSGRVGSLLEVGTGFHPELTGRENIFLNGAILGMSRREILDRFDAIVEFAGTERFLDTPVKHYSSGMSMRLAFAVASQLEPELLLIDEVLAVGDGDFQKKCLGRMGDLATAGRTIVFVSHNLTAVRTLCQSAVWLERGKVIVRGPVNDVVNAYIESAESLASERAWDSPDGAPGNSLLRLRRVRVAPSRTSTAKSISVDTPIDIDFELWNLMSEASLNLSLVVYSLEGNCIFNSIAPAANVAAGVFRGRCHVPGNLLNDGVYTVRLLVARDQASVIFDVSDLATFEVHDVERPILWFGKLIGAVRPQLDWQIGALDDGAVGDENDRQGL
jgi:lipopolysaccharide transport system ATP-binding protein